MGYELEMPTRDFYAATVDLRRLERAACDADQRLSDALARGRQLRGHVGADDPVWLAAQIRIVEARHRWQEAIDALSEIAIDTD